MGTWLRSGLSGICYIAGSVRRAFLALASVPCYAHCQSSNPIRRLSTHPRSAARSAGKFPRDHRRRDPTAMDGASPHPYLSLSRPLLTQHLTTVHRPDAHDHPTRPRLALAARPTRLHPRSRTRPFARQRLGAADHQAGSRSRRLGQLDPCERDGELERRGAPLAARVDVEG